jgi:hypothetical protein
VCGVWVCVCVLEHRVKASTNWPHIHTVCVWGGGLRQQREHKGKQRCVTQGKERERAGAGLGRVRTANDSAAAGRALDLTGAAGWDITVAHDRCAYRRVVCALFCPVLSTHVRTCVSVTLGSLKPSLVLLRPAPYLHGVRGTARHSTAQHGRTHQKPQCTATPSAIHRFC